MTAAILSALLLSTEMIPREKLFRQPECIIIKISPDGKRLAYVGADLEGTMNVFVSPDLNLKNSKKLTDFKEPEIKAFHWSFDGRKILFLKNEKGIPNFTLYSIDTTTEKVTQLVTNAKIFALSATANEAIIGVNKRDSKFYDLYSLNLATNELTLLLTNNRFIQFLFDENLEIGLQIELNEDASMDVFTNSDKQLFHISSEDAFHTGFLHYSAEENFFFMLDNRDTNTTTLKKISLLTEEERIIGHDPKSDIGEVLFDGNDVAAYSTNYLKKEWHLLNKDYSFLAPSYEVISKSADKKLWILESCLPERGIEFFLYNSDTKEKTSLYSFPDGEKLSKMYPQVIRSRDGLDLVSYLTLPNELDGNGKPTKPLPLIVFPHGGPFKARDSYTFDPFHQWLANRGYAVLSVNFRLSSGFGKDFVNAGNGQWGKKAHDDIIDAVNWCIKEKITEEGKVGIMGGSYGGYETLAALTFTPEKFACGVALCAPSNVRTVLDTCPFYWEFPVTAVSDSIVFFTRNAFVKSIGPDPESSSPLNFVDRIQKPLLLAHGRNDPIVSIAESDQIFAKIKEKNLSALYLSFPDEGHRFMKFANFMTILANAEKLLAEVLGGKVEPLDEKTLKKSSVILKTSGKFGNETP